MFGNRGSYGTVCPRPFNISGFLTTPSFPLISISTTYGLALQKNFLSEKFYLVSIVENVTISLLYISACQIIDFSFRFIIIVDDDNFRACIEQLLFCMM